MTKIITSAKQELPEETYLDGLKQLAKQFWQGDEMESALAAIERMRVTSSRSVSPGRRKKTSPDTTPRALHQRRTTTMAQELEEAQSNLEYTYTVEGMDVEKKS